MSKYDYDEAYERESRKFPAIFRMTRTNLIIWLIMLIIYIGGSFLLAFVLSEGEVVDLFFLLLGVVVNMAILGFAYKCIRGDAHIFFQGLMLILIPIWALASVIIPDLRFLANWLFIFPLLWLEIMIIVEGIIHRRAQRTAIDIAEYEREHMEKMRRNSDIF